MIYTPFELKKNKMNEQVFNYLDEHFEECIGLSGGRIKIPNTWDSSYVEIAATILKNSGWETKPVVGEMFALLNELPNSKDDKYLLIEPLHILTKEEYLILKSSKTAIISEAINPSDKRIIDLLVDDEVIDEPYPSFELKNKDENKDENKEGEK